MSTGTRDNALDLRVRLGGLQLVRVFVVVSIAAAAVSAPQRGDAGYADWVPWALAYAAATSVFELGRRRLRARWLGAAMSLLAVDAVFVAGAFDAGAGGALSFLPALHAVAVVALVGPTAGVRVALLHVGMLFAALVHHRVEGTLLSDASVYAFAASGVIAATAGSILLLATLDRSHAQRRERLAALARLTEACQRATSVHDVAAALTDTVCETFGLVRGVVSFEAADDQRPGGAVLLARLGPEHEPVRGALGDPDNVVWVPLVDGCGQSLGVGGFVAGPNVRAMSGEDVELIERLCAHAALAVVNIRLREEIEHLATSDPLTGLANRRQLTERLGAELARSRRHGLAFAVVGIDVDHFKSVNDTHGHAVGDEVLVGVSEALRAQCRESDLPARSGGEEFVVLLPETGLSEALAFAERLRVAVARSGTAVPVTVSAGVASFPETAEEPDALLIAADEALYEAKAGGRDRVCASRRGAPVSQEVGLGARRRRRMEPLRAKAS